MGFGHRIYRAEDPRSRILKRTAKELGSPQVEIAEELEEAALAALAGASPGARARDERRVLLGGRARRRRDPAAARTGDVRLLARRRLVGPHPRAEAHRPAVPAVGALRRSRAALTAARVTLAEAAGEADALAGPATNARSRPPRRVGRRDRGRGAPRRLPRARLAYRAIAQFRFRQKLELLRRGLEDESPARAARR